MGLLKIRWFNSICDYHKMMYMVMGDKNYVGPVEQVLTAPGRRKKQILDIGTGSGIWSVLTLLIGGAQS